MKDLPKRDDRVYHSTFGNGTVIRIHKQSMGPEVEVEFDKYGKKSLIWKLAQTKMQLINLENYTECKFCGYLIDKKTPDAHECMGSLRNRVNELTQTLANIQAAWNTSDSEALKNAIFEQGEFNA